jgi:hypothetical protein
MTDVPSLLIELWKYVDTNDLAEIKSIAAVIQK